MGLKGQPVDRDKVFDKILTVNSRVTLVVPEGLNAGTYHTRVEDLTMEEVTIAGPIFKDTPVWLQQNSRVTISLLSENGVYEFDGRVQQLVRDPLYLVVLNVPPEEPVYLLQRRQFVRLECRLPIQYQLILDEKENEKIRDTLIQTYTLNISGNGVCMVLDHNLTKGTCVDLYLSLDSKRPPICILGEVVRTCKSFEESGKTKYVMGLQFVEMRRIDQDRIVKYIFQQERKKVRQE